MKRIVTFFALFFIFSLKLWAQAPANCSGTSTVKMLIAGDSWAQYMADDNVYNTVFNQYGHADKQTIASTYEVVIALWGSGSPDPWDYTVSGSEAREWADEANYPYIQNVRNALIANPDVNTVLLSIGGNDILAARCDGGWYQNMDMNGAGNEAALLNTIMSNTQYIVNQILAVRPNINVIISSYDYPNFNVQGAWLGCLWVCNLCDLYACEERKKLSFSPITAPLTTCESVIPSAVITDAGINVMMRTIEQQRQTYADAQPRVVYDNSIGLMHYFYGTGSSGPGSLPAPLGISPYTPGGSPNTPSLRENFRLVNISNWFDAPADPIHLTAEGYTYKAKNLMDNYLFNSVLRGTPNSTFLSEGTKDGYVYVYDDNSPQSVSSNGIRVGDNGVDFWTNNNEYYGILSFNTANLPDNATIQGGSLYMIRSSENDNPFLHTDRNPVLDIKSGFFGSTDNLELADWNAASSASNIGCFNGTADADKYAIRIDLQPAALSAVNKTGRTQFRMKFDYADFSPEYINFYDGDQIGGIVEPSEDEQRLAVGDNQFYSEFTVRKKPNTPEEIVEKSKPIEKPAGYVLEKVQLASWLEPDSTQVTQYKMLLALEHEGLARLMGTKAPFLDIWYTISSVPIELEQFNVKPDQGAALLRWTTASEKNTRLFGIEHSVDGQNWQSIGTVPAAGNSNTRQHYQFRHLKPVDGTNFYRLQTVDLDEKTEYSDIRSLEWNNRQLIFEVFPNPFDAQINVELALDTDETAQIQVLDPLGRILLNQTVLSNNGDLQVFALEQTAQWNPGTYYLQMQTRIGTKTVKIVKK